MNVIIRSSRSLSARSSTSITSFAFAQFSSAPEKEADDASAPRVLVTPLGNGIVNVELNRGSKYNALDMRMFEELSQAAVDLKKDKSIRAVILSGSGKAFCTGLDVKSIAAAPLKNTDKLLQRPSHTEITNLAQDVGYLWRTLPVPVIASIHGMCYGGGMQIVLGADFRFATPTAKLSIMEAKWGLIPDMSGTITLRELVRMDVAKELSMTGRIFDAVEGEKLGLITRTAEDPFEESMKLAIEIVNRSPDAVAATKKLFQNTWMATEAEALVIETDLQNTLLPSWNQLAASAKNFGVTKVPYLNRKEREGN
jgi:enoyl-CoA hydratase/carnithine racemase